MSTHITKVRTGSVCVVRSTGIAGEVEMQRTDKFSTHDRGSSPQGIPGLGMFRHQAGETSFKILQSHGFRTHFVKRVSSDTMCVREFEIPGVPVLSGSSHGTAISLEWLVRWEITPKMVGRLATGELTRERLGLKSDTHIYIGMELPKLFHECSTKREPVDRYVSDKEALAIGGFSENVFDKCRALIECATNSIRQVMYKAGYRYVDGKYELGLNWSCDPVIIDTCGTQDECRIAHRKTGEQHSKEPLRQYLESHPWFSELQAAKKTYPDDKSKWPPYPVVPHEIVVTTQQLYRQFAEDYEQARIEMYGA